MIRVKDLELAKDPNYIIVSDVNGKGNWEPFDTYLASRNVTLYTFSDDGGSYDFDIGDTRNLTIAGETNELSVGSSKVGSTITETITFDPRYFVTEQLFDAATNVTSTVWFIPIPPEWNGKKIISATFAGGVIGSGEDITWTVETDQGGTQTLVSTVATTEANPCVTQSANTTLTSCEKIVVSITGATGTPTGAAFTLTIQ